MYTYLNRNGQNWNQRQWKEYSLDMMKRDKEEWEDPFEKEQSGQIPIQKGG